MTVDTRLTEAGLAGADVVVESTEPGARALAGLLRIEGAHVRLADPAELDRNPRAGVAFLDVWTPEVAPRVQGLRAAGAYVTCLADLVLARSQAPVLAVTGTAGKTTTTFLAAQLLGHAGIDFVLPRPGLSGNLWPEISLLGGRGGAAPLLVELTSSHLAFCNASPHVAVVTSFWPDHVELHGSVEAYARAKETLVRSQTSTDWLVIPGDGSCDRFAHASAAAVARFSLSHPVARGAFVRRGRLVVRWQDEEHELANVEALPLPGGLVANALAACVTAVAAGAPPGALADGLRRMKLPPFRLVEVGRVAGIPVLDDSMAGTPAKAGVALESFPDHSVVLVAGGELHGAAGPVHRSPEEQDLLAAAVALAARKTRHAILFGSAAEELAGHLPGATLVDGLGDAIALALGAAQGASAVLIAPMYPVSPAERDQVAPRVRALLAAPSL